MKKLSKLTLLILISIVCLPGMAQKPEPVYSIIRQIHDFDWYEQQAKAWKQEIDKGTKDKMAWVYWFKANRYARFADEKKWESNANNYFISPDKLVKLSEKAIPKSFEYYFLKANDDKAGNGNESIMKAQEIRPYDPLLLPWLMNYYEFKQDKTNLEITAKKWIDSNEMPQELLTTAYNNIISLEPNAILLVNGDNDTYPSWVLQNAKKIRTDVTVVNISLATIESYRNDLFNLNAIPALKIEDASENTPSAVINHIIEKVENRPVYISAFVADDSYKKYANQMYLTGLSYKYSKEPFDNLAVIRNNVENKYLLDYLKQTFNNNYAQSVINQMNTGYLAIFLKLYEHYKASGETVKAQKLKELATTVAERGNTTDWLKYFEK